MTLKNRNVLISVVSNNVVLVYLVGLVELTYVFIVEQLLPLVTTSHSYAAFIFFLFYDARRRSECTV